MQLSDNKTGAYERYCKITDAIYKCMVFLCVCCLAVEIFSVLVMVVGRYIFNNVPVWCDQLSLMALIWMAILSINLAVYDETHMRVELIDRLLPARIIAGLKYFNNLIILAFSALMIYHGYIMVELTRKVTISGFRVSQAWMYFPLILCGLTSVHMSLFCIVRRWKEGHP